VRQFTSSPLLVLGSCLLFLTVPLSVLAQITSVNNSTSTPIEGTGRDYMKLLSETVDPVNGSTSLRLKLPVPTARGLSIPFAFSYDSNGVAFPTSNPSLPGLSSWGFAKVDVGPGLVSAGWSYSVPMLTYLSLIQQVQNGQITVCQTMTGFVLQDATGGRHSLNVAHILNTSTNCTGYPLDQVEKDSGGDDYYQASLSLGTTPSVISAAGTNYSFPYAGMQGTGQIAAELPTSIEDSNGNIVLIRTGTNNSFTETDTLGRPALATSGFGHTGDTVTVSGVTTPFTLTWGSTTTNFTSSNYNEAPQTTGCSSFGSPGNGPPVVTAISLPNGRQYTFTYDSTYGTLNKITYPSGGYVSYTWGVNQYSALATFPANDPSNPQALCQFIYSKPAVTDRYVSFDGSTIALHQHFSYSTTWNGGQWTSKQTIVTTTDNVSGVTFTATYNYAPLPGPNVPNQPASIDNQIPLETTVVLKGSNGVMMRTTSKSWFDQYELKSEQTTLENGSVSEVDYQFGPGAQITQKSEYDFATGAHGPLLRKSIRNYQSFGTTAILDRPCQSLTYDGSGNRIAESDYFYDGRGGSTPCLVTAAQALAGSGVYTDHDESAYGPSRTPYRGNLTKVINQCFIGSQNCASGNSITTYGYDETGQILSMTDACGNGSCADMSGTNHSATYSYADNYDSPSSTNTNAYVTKITNAIGQSSSFKYAYSDGQLIQSTDPNGQPTLYSYVDSLRRLTETDFPDNGQTKIAYNDTAIPPTITTSRLMNTSNVYVTSVATLDGLGHIVKTLLTVDQDCANGDRTDTTYDGLGHIYTVSNPYCAAGEGTSGLTTYIYDGLGRTTTVTHPDGATILTSYTGRATEVQDEGNGTQRVTRISQSDGLGRLTSLCEVSSATLIGQNAAPAACNQDIGASGFLTSYQYNALDDLTQVTQGTMPSRAFGYDSLSRLSSGANPESGTTTYSYDANNNLASKTAPAPNQTGTATVTTTYSYDALNRLTQKSYSDTNPVYANGTPTVFYGYDQSSITMAFQHNIANGIGRLSWSAPVDQHFFPITMDAFSYDQVGRVKQYWQQEPVNRNVTDQVVGYDYDLIGDPADFFVAANQATPQGVVQNLTYNGVGRLTSFSGNGFNDATHPANLISGIAYDALGLMTSATFASGLTQSWAYNKRGSVTNMAVGTGCSSGTCSSSKYSYALARAPNGNITSATDTVNQNWTYSYDALNRLICSSLSANGTCPTSGTPTFSYTYDRFGNRWNQTGPNTFNATFTGNSPATPQNNNRIDGYCYDGAGNLLDQGPCLTGANPTQAFKYDAENRLIAVNQGATTYIYDGQGRRVQKNTGSTTESYLFDKDSNPISNWISGSPTYDDSAGYIGNWHFLTCFVNAAHNACTIYFHYGDWLGSKRISTDVAGTIAETCTSLPFGDGQNCTGAQDVSPMHFTGKERDSESGLDNFGARYDSSSMGRFMTPDPLLNSGRPWEPQSWNRYAYVLNNPLNIVDPTGLYDLVNSCASDDDKCKKRFRQHADDLKKGVANLQKKVDKMKDGPEKQRLEAALTAFGTEGDHNGVNATFGTLGGDAAAETKYQSNDIGQLTATVTFDSSKISGSNEYGIDAAHEGTHIEDTLTEAVNDYIAHGSLPGLSDFSREYRGYQTSIFAASALGQNSFSRNYGSVNYVLWNGSWAQVDRNITNYVTRFHDQNGRPDHPETTPHNPWPN
jgi:RHS repeat-associated protein